MTMRSLYPTVLLLFLLTGFLHADAQSWLWASSAGSMGDDAGYSVATDSSGDVYVAGYFGTPSITFGSTTLTNAGSGDIFLVKYNPMGGVIGAISAGGSLLDRCYAMKTDKHGNVYLAGYFQSSSITFGGYTLTKTGSNADLFVVKMNPSGTTLWARNTGVASNDMDVKSVAVDTLGNVYVVGSFGGPTLTFGSTVLSNGGSFPFNDMYVVKYNAAGSFVWAKRAGGTQDEIANSVATDAAGNVYVAGYFSSPSVVFGSTTLTTSASSDMFLVKYDSSGSVVWAKNSGSSSMGQSVAIDTSGDVFVSGIFYPPSVTFGTTTLTNAGSGDAFLVKYSSTGSVVWANSLGGPGAESGACVHVSATNDVYTTGYFFSSSVTVGSTTLTNAGMANMYVVRCTSGGALVSAISGSPYATNGSLGGIAVTTDPSGYNMYVAGTLAGDSAAVGTTILHNMGTVSNSDMFVARYGMPATTNVQVAGTEHVAIYPNPVNNEMTIAYDPCNNGDGVFQLSDITGRVVLSVPLDGKKKTAMMNTSGLMPGLYLYKITRKGATSAIGRVIKE